MRKDPTEFRKRFAAWKNGKQPYKDGKPVVLNNYTNAKFNDDGTFTDDTTRMFDDFYVTPSGVKTKYGSYTDKNWDRYKQQEAFFRTHDQQTGNLKYEPGLEIVSPEFDLLTGIRALMPTINGLDRKTYHVAREMNKGLKKNPILKSYNSSPSYLDTGGNVLQYLDYINSLFPNSKVKDIVYHSTWAKPFEQFDPGKIKRGYGFYFSPSENHLPFDRMVYSRVNILNPLEIFPNKNRNLDVSGLWRKDLTELAIKNGQHDGVIGVSNMRNPGEPEIVALNPNQIHILRSTKDKKIFKDFVEDSGIKSWTSVESPKQYIREPYSVSLDDFVKNPKLGKYIDQGGEATIRETSGNPNYVTKIKDQLDNSETLSDLESVVNRDLHINDLPGTEPIRYKGFTGETSTWRTLNRNTGLPVFHRQDQFYPIFEQRKLTPSHKVNFDTFGGVDTKSMINEWMYNHGYRYLPDGTYKYGNIIISDNALNNFAFDSFGNMKFIDPMIKKF